MNDKHDDPEMIEALIKGTAQYIAKGWLHTKKPAHTEDQILAEARRGMDDVAQYGYSFSDGTAEHVVSEANELATRQAETNINFDQWAFGH